MAIKYVDYVNGLDTNSGNAIGDAYKTINKATSEARTAGDIIKVRGGQTHAVVADITFLSAGTVNSLITLKGCYTVDDDPWSDGATTRPIVDFGNAAYQMYQSANFWKVMNLDVYNSADTVGALRVNAGGIVIENCIFRNSIYGVYGGYPCSIKDSVIHTCTTAGIFISAGMILENVQIYGCGKGMIGSSYAIVYMKDCLFGMPSENTSADIDVWRYTLQVLGRNCKLASTVEVLNLTQTTWPGIYNFVKLEDDEQTHLAYRAWYFAGYVSRNTDVTRVGGAAFSMLVEPNSNCGAEQSLYGIGDWLEGMPIYLDGTEQTITVYCRSADWTTEPTSAQFYIELDYYSAAGVWTTVQSNDALVDDSWVAFDVTVTAAEAGFAYLKAVLKKYEAGAKVYIDPKPVIS